MAVQASWLQQKYNNSAHESHSGKLLCVES